MSTDLVAYSSSTLEQRKSYAQTLANAGDLIPKGLFAPVRNADGSMSPPAPSAGKVLLVMETGAMLGIHPVAALQGVHIIEGKATLSPALMSAVIRKAGHKLRVTTTGSIDSRDFAATATLTRSDDPDFTYSATWTMERAKRAGLDQKDVWKKYGEAMCKARAISEVCREGGEDALMGVHYTPEELDATVTEDGSADVVDADLEPTEPWEQLVADATTKDELLRIAKRATDLGEYPDALRTKVLTKIGAMTRTVVPEDLGAPEVPPAAEDIVDAEVVTDEPADEQEPAKDPRAEEAAQLADLAARAEAARTAPAKPGPVAPEPTPSTEADDVAYDAYRTDGGGASFELWRKERDARVAAQAVAAIDPAEPTEEERAQLADIEARELAAWQAKQVKP